MSARRALLALVAVIVVGAGAAVLISHGAAGREGWSTPERLEAVGVGVARVDVASDGRVLAAWSEERRGLWSVKAAERSPDGRWGEPVEVVSGKRWTIRVTGAELNDAGDAVVLLSYSSGARSLVLAAARPRGGGWLAPEPLTRVTYAGQDGALALDESGAAAVASGGFFDDAGLTVAMRTPDGVWHGPRRVAGAHSVNAIDVASGAGRFAVAATASSRPQRGGVGLAARILVGPASGPLRPLRRLPADGSTMAFVTATFDADGRLALAWRDLTTPGRSRLLVARQVARGSWSRPAVLDRGVAADAAPPRIVATETGIVVAWSRWDRPGREASVRAAVLDQAGRLVGNERLDSFALPDTRGPGAVASSPGPPPAQLLLAGRGGRASVLWTRPEAPTASEPAPMSLRWSERADDGWTAGEELPDGAPVSVPLAYTYSDAGLVAAWASVLDDGRVSGLHLAARDG